MENFLEGWGLLFVNLGHFGALKFCPVFFGQVYAIFLTEGEGGAGFYVKVPVVGFCQFTLFKQGEGGGGGGELLPLYFLGAGQGLWWSLLAPSIF